MPCRSTLIQASAVKHVQAVTTVDEALLGTCMDALHVHNNYRLPDCFVSAVAIVTVSHHVLQEAKDHNNNNDNFAFQLVMS